jgi:hypothetical protein
MHEQSLDRLYEWARAADLSARQALYDPTTEAVEHVRGAAESYAWWWLHASELAVGHGRSLARLMGWAEGFAAADERQSLGRRAEGRRAATARVLRVVVFGTPE